MVLLTFSWIRSKMHLAPFSGYLENLLARLTLHKLNLVIYPKLWKKDQHIKQLHNVCFFDKCRKYLFSRRK